jgi:hypothetical protein
MLTLHERKFMDLWLREEYTHDYQGHAQTASRDRGITYDHYVKHYVKLYPFYQEAWKLIGQWPDHLPPLPDDPNLPCPWESQEKLEARLQELKSFIAH